MIPKFPNILYRKSAVKYLLSISPYKSAVCTYSGNTPTFTNMEGSVVSTKGAFEKRERMFEELYFYRLQKQRIAELRAMLAREEKLFKDIYCKDEQGLFDNSISSHSKQKSDSVQNHVLHGSEQATS